MRPQRWVQFGVAHVRHIAALIGLAALPATAHAYFDPGTGSLLIQAVIGGLAAVAVFWGNLKAFVRNLFSRRPPASEDAGEQSTKPDR